MSVKIENIDIDIIIQTIIDRLKPFNPIKIILFGSYVYGSPTSDSDIDICIIKKEIHSKSKERLEIRKKLSDIRFAKDILLSTETEYNYYKNQVGSVFMDIDTKGRILWSN